MNIYYKESLEKGLQFQDFVMELLIKEIGIPINNFSSKKYQFEKGENKQGIEIKFDDRYKETGNIYIEIAEKSDPNNKNFVNSGIMRYDNSWLYLIGDYNIIFIFPIKYLRMIKNKKSIITISMGTSKGYLLYKDEIDKYCIRKIINDKQ